MRRYQGIPHTENRPIIDWYSLTAQMVLSFIALVLLTTAAVGLPAIALIRKQIESQAWAQVNQGSQATQALYNAIQSNINDLVTLTAQRPTLKQLLEEGDAALLSDYLQTLQKGTDLDLLKACDSNNKPLARTGQSLTSGFCESALGAGFYVLSSETGEQIWLLAAETIEDGASFLGRVVVGITLGDAFAQQMKSQTGLEHTLLVDRQPVASSITGGATGWLTASHAAVENVVSGVGQAAEFELNGNPFYAARLTDIDPSFEDEVALNVANVVATEQRLVGLLSGSIVLVVLIGSILGVFLARRVSRPLTKLANAA